MIEPKTSPLDPEKKLLIAVLAQTIKDIEKAGGRDFSTAWLYVFESQKFEDHCNYLGYDAESIRERVERKLVSRSIAYDELSEGKRQAAWITMQHKNVQLRSQNAKLTRQIGVLKRRLALTEQRLDQLLTGAGMYEARDKA